MRGGLALTLTTVIAASAFGASAQADEIKAFLASADSAWITGERLSVTGGYR